MASFSAQFSAAGTAPLEVTHCKYGFKQTIDDKGKPSSVVQGGIVEVTVLSTCDVDSQKLISYMLDAFKQAEGKIEFKRGDQDSIMKKIEFSGAYLVEYSEVFDARGREDEPAMLTTMKISADVFTVDGASLKNHWK